MSQESSNSKVCGTKYRIPKIPKKEPQVPQVPQEPKKKNQKMTYAKKLRSPLYKYASRKVPRNSKSALGPPDENKQASSSHQSIFKQIEELNGKKTKNRSKLNFKKIRKELRHTQ